MPAATSARSCETTASMCFGFRFLGFSWWTPAACRRRSKSRLKLAKAACVPYDAGPPSSPVRRRPPTAMIAGFPCLRDMDNPPFQIVSLSDRDTPLIP